jgi:hypothetical protein
MRTWINLLLTLAILIVLVLTSGCGKEVNELDNFFDHPIIISPPTVVIAPVVVSLPSSPVITTCEAPEVLSCKGFACECSTSTD